MASLLQSTYIIANRQAGHETVRTSQSLQAANLARGTVYTEPYTSHNSERQSNLQSSIVNSLVAPRSTMAPTPPISVSTPTKPIKSILSVKVFIAPEKQAEFWQHYKPVFDKVVAEPECRYFVAGTHAMDPTCLCWSEGWSEGVEWLQTVRTTRFLQPRLVVRWCGGANG